MDEILTVREVAEYLKLSRTTVWRWCNDGKLPAFKVGRGWRIHRLEIERITGHSPKPTDAMREEGLIQPANARTHTRSAVDRADPDRNPHPTAGGGQ